jgi:hypothetical protein
MPRALPRAIREQIIELHDQGQTLGEIATALGLSYSTVRAVWRRYRDGGTEGLATRYHLCGSREAEFSTTVEQAAIALRSQHPDWSAARILESLRTQCPEEAMPTVRTLQRWFEAAGLARARGQARRVQDFEIGDQTSSSTDAV